LQHVVFRVDLFDSIRIHQDSELPHEILDIQYDNEAGLEDDSYASLAPLIAKLHTSSSPIKASQRPEFSAGMYGSVPLSYPGIPPGPSIFEQTSASQKESEKLEKNKGKGRDSLGTDSSPMPRAVFFKSSDFSTATTPVAINDPIDEYVQRDSSSLSESPPSPEIRRWSRHGPDT
jgi:hypothetical protein